MLSGVFNLYIKCEWTATQLRMVLSNGKNSSNDLKVCAILYSFFGMDGSIVIDDSTQNGDCSLGQVRKTRAIMWL